MPTGQFLPEELALLAAIHAEPREDSVRLVYADWVQEHGQPEYAEFIRWQIESGLIARYYVARKAAVLHNVLTPSLLSPTVLDNDVLPPALRLPHSLLARLFPRRALRGAPLVTYVRGMPTVDVKDVIGSARAFSDLASVFHPSVRFQDVGITLDRLTDPLEMILTDPVLRRADDLRVECARDVIGIDEFVDVASEAGLLDRILSVSLMTESLEVATRLEILLKPIHVDESRETGSRNLRFIYWLRDRERASGN